MFVTMCYDSLVKCLTINNVTKGYLRLFDTIYIVISTIKDSVTFNRLQNNNEEVWGVTLIP